jgi:hypothetical protein
MMNNNYIDFLVSFIKGQVSKYDGNKEFIDSLLVGKASLIREMASNFNYPDVDDVTLNEYFLKAVRVYNSNNVIEIEEKESLVKKGYQTWLIGDRMNISWNYSDRYFQYLRKIGRSEKVIEEVKNSSLDILSKFADPKSAKKQYVKGLVVGEVQSGKTGNFNAVINRAIDSGYKIIIVLSGIMEDLRSQTQDRIESDVVGEGRDSDTQILGDKGVGALVERFGPRGNSQIEQIVSITSTKSDFNKAIKEADFSINRTNILVCKKNVYLLRNLIGWLYDSKGTAQFLNLPLLILDDEADNASLNNYGSKGKEHASKINGQIRALLDLFSTKTYLGYTATPFANVLQDRNEKPDGYWIEKYRVNGEFQERNFAQVDNIFPDDFIELLKSPSNYVGAKQLFETVQPIENKTENNDKIPLVETVLDNVEYFPTRVLKDDPRIGVKRINNNAEWEDITYPNGTYLHFNSFNDYRTGTRASKKEDIFPLSLPRSLEEAIHCFILSMAIRESRKGKIMNTSFYNPHHSMLVHISRFTTWQNRTNDLIQTYVNKLIFRINNDKINAPDSIYKQLEVDWYNNYAHIVENIRKYLPIGYVDDFMTPIVFDSLKTNLPKTVEGIEVKAINSVTKAKLEYPKNSPKKIIAIGGNRLSRGFTLEGLTINYFIRATDYSDSLFQMGRWFGYRPGYLDCCKIFTTTDSIEKFDSTTKCIEELELLFRKMSRLKREPRNFAIRVKTHPGTLKITRSSILKNAREEKWSFEDQLEQTTKFNISKNKIEKCWKSFNDLIAPNLYQDPKSDFLIYKTDSLGIIDILNSENNFYFDKNKDEVEGMVKFIQLCNDQHILNDWTIAVKTSGNGNFLKKSISNIPSNTKEIKMAIRRGPDKKYPIECNNFINQKIFKATGRNANIVTVGSDFSILLSKSQISKAEEEFFNEKRDYYVKKGYTIEKAEIDARKITKPERIYREKMDKTQGLLVVYLFDPLYVFNQEEKRKDDNAYHKFHELVKNEDINPDIPLIGFAIGFPPIEEDIGGVYMRGEYDLDDIEEDQELMEAELNEDLNFD